MKTDRIWILLLSMGLLLAVLWWSGFDLQTSRAQVGLPGVGSKPQASPLEADLGVGGQRGPSAINADIGAGFSYQGMLTGAGGTALNGVCNILFRLYDAASGGTKIGGDSYAQQVKVTNGLFTAQANSQNEFGDTAFQGQPRYLQVAVKCNADTGYTHLSPRQTIFGTPYALGLRPGLSIVGTSSQGLVAQNNYNMGVTKGLVGKVVSAANGVGVHGVNYWSDESGKGVGVLGESYELLGYGVKGINYNDGTAIYGESNGYFTSIGVKGISYKGYGVLGETTEGFAIVGRATGIPGDALMLEAPNGRNLIIGYQNRYSGDREFVVTSSGDVYADGQFYPGGADMAEMLPAMQGLEPGDVLVIGGDGLLQRCTHPKQNNLAGVYSTQPGIVGGAGEGVDLSGQVPLAVVGVAPVKVSAENGAIRPGDLLTTSATPGHAMKAKPITVNGETIYPTGIILGKALGSLAHGTGVIKVLITLQ